MSTPTPRDDHSAARTMSPEERARALAELHRQMVELNARLEYLSLILKLGVR
jgi:ribosomal protein L29